MGDVIEWKRGLAAEVVHLFPHPKPEFGKRKRGSVPQLGLLAGGFGEVLDAALGGDARKAKRAGHGIEALDISDALDALSVRADALGHSAGKPALLLIARDLENLSERLVLIAAEIGE
jgi:hypothetical protein